MGSRILLADDSITIQKVVNLTFADEGIEVVAVSNGDMAERRMREVNPDLVLADIFMPGKNGYELCETIKRSPQFSNVPVVLLVGAFEPFNEVEAKRVQADAHLTKPFESRLLVETVRNLIDRSPRPKVNTASLVNPPHESATPVATASPQPGVNAVRVPPVTLDMAAMGVPPAQDNVFADPSPASYATDATPFADSFPSSFENQNSHAAHTAQPTTIQFSTEPPTAPASNEAAFDMTQQFYTFNQSALSAATEAAEFPPAAGESLPTFHDTPNQLAVEAPASLAPVDESSPLGDTVFDLGDANATRVFGSTPALAEFTTPSPVNPADVVVDFDRVESFEEPAPEDIVSFEVETAGQEAAGDLKADDPATDDLRTNALDTNELAEAPTEKLAAGEALDSREFTFYESGESATTLLKSEEPLGDVLSDSLTQESYGFGAPAPTPLELDEPVAAASAATESASEVVSTAPEAHTAELEDVENADTSFAFYTPAPPQQEFSTDGDDGSVAANVEVNDVSGAASAVEVVLPASPEPIPFVKELSSGVEYNFYTEAASEEEVQMASSNDAAAGQVADATEIKSEAMTVAPGGAEAGQATGTDESGATFSTPLSTPDSELASHEGAAWAEGDSALPLATVSASGETTAGATTEEAAEEAFTASDMWAEQPQFTPISVEMAPVAESVTPTPKALPQETAKEAVAAGAEGQEKAGVEMSQEMINEIVRRVVAQLSDTVVREIAWEVVPDCVERVVSNLTREGLEKNQ